MKDLTNEILQALLSAPNECKQLALQVLKGRKPQPSVTTQELYLSQKKLATLLNVHPATIWRWKVPCHNWGGSQRYLLSEVQAYLEGIKFQQHISQLRHKEAC